MYVHSVGTVPCLSLCNQSPMGFWSGLYIHYLLLWMVASIFACEAIPLKGLNYSLCLTITFNKAWDSHWIQNPINVGQ